MEQAEGVSSFYISPEVKMDFDAEWKEEMVVPKLDQQLNTIEVEIAELTGLKRDRNVYVKKGGVFLLNRDHSVVIQQRIDEKKRVEKKKKEAQQ